MLAAADVAIVVDGGGVVKDVAFRNDDLGRELGDVRSWLGRRWRAIVTVESRNKLDVLLADAGSDRPMRWRHINHPKTDGGDVPISYSAVQMGADGSVIAVGRDLRPMATLQQRLVEAQQSLERDYTGLRQAEARYRMLFDMSQDAVAFVDGGSSRILDLNPAARRLAGAGTRRSSGRTFPELFDEPSRDVVRQALSTARASGRSETARAVVAGQPIELAIAALREGDGLTLLVRMTSRETGPASDSASGVPEGETMPALLEQMPDALAVTDEQGDLVFVNAAFRMLTGLAPSEPVRGETLARWIGQEGVDLDILIANLRQRDVVRLFATTLRPGAGSAIEVEISASVLPERNAGYAFFIRNVARRLPVESRLSGNLTQSVERVSQLIGRVSLRELVRESTDSIERLCIEAALEMTGNNRAAAAEMLGLSRQSLYVKLRRYGFGDGSDGADEDFAS